MSKILAFFSGCSMAACFLSGVLAIAAYGILASVPPKLPKLPAPTPAGPAPAPTPAPKPASPAPTNPYNPKRPGPH